MTGLTCLVNILSNVTIMAKTDADYEDMMDVIKVALKNCTDYIWTLEVASESICSQIKLIAIPNTFDMCIAKVLKNIDGLKTLK